ncbi:hypothetical protein ACFFMN_23515 [Planobispora siamensis]|nr:hypothetical protein [Planobispora siamensis]
MLEMSGRTPSTWALEVLARVLLWVDMAALAVAVRLHDAVLVAISIVALPVIGIGMILLSLDRVERMRARVDRPKTATAPYRPIC